MFRYHAKKWNYIISLSDTDTTLILHSIYFMHCNLIQISSIEMIQVLRFDSECWAFPMSTYATICWIYCRSYTWILIKQCWICCIEFSLAYIYCLKCYSLSYIYLVNYKYDGSSKLHCVLMWFWCHAMPSHTRFTMNFLRFYISIIRETPFEYKNAFVWLSVQYSENSSGETHETWRFTLQTKKKMRKFQYSTGQMWYDAVELFLLIFVTLELKFIFNLGNKVSPFKNLLIK